MLIHPHLKRAELVDEKYPWQHVHAHSAYYRGSELARNRVLIRNEDGRCGGACTHEGVIVMGINTCIARVPEHAPIACG